MENNASSDEPVAYTDGFLKQDYDKVLESLEKDPTQTSLVFGSIETTLLHAAAYDGKAVIVERLIDLGADVNAKESSGRTPLHHAANNGHIDVIVELVRSGADIESKDAGGMTPLMWAKISRTGIKDDIVAKLLELGAKGE